MKTPSLVSLVLTLLSLGTAMVAIEQHHRLTAIRERRVRINEGSPPATTTRESTIESSFTNSPAELSPAEHLELLQLRGRVRPLMDQIAEARTGTKRVAQLRVQLANLRKLSEPPSPGYIRRSEARNLGNGTPETVFETFLWAAEHRDASTLLGLLDEPGRQSLERQLNDQGPDKFFHEVTSLPGGRVVQRKESQDHTVELEVEFTPGMTNRIKFQPATNGWVMVFF
jgi:hypothetical protein